MSFCFVLVVRMVATMGATGGTSVIEEPEPPTDSEPVDLEEVEVKFCTKTSDEEIGEPETPGTQDPVDEPPQEQQQAEPVEQAVPEEQSEEQAEQTPSLDIPLMDKPEEKKDVS